MTIAFRSWALLGILLAAAAPSFAVQRNNATASGATGFNAASTKPYPSALAATYSVSGTNLQIVNNTGPLTTVGGATPAMFTPNVPTDTTGIQLQAEGTGCSFANDAAMTTSCARGTLTIAFSRPVANPIVHFVGLGSVRSVTGDTTTITAGRAAHTLAASVPAGATMALLAGATNLQVLGGASLDLANPAYNGTSCSTVTAPATALGGCGSVRINGTVSSVSFDVSLAGTRNVFNALIGNEVGADGYMVTTSVDEDFGDAPASYDPVEAASHVVDGLRLGAGLDADNTTVFNDTPAVTPSPNAVAAGGDSNGAAGDGADEDGLATPLPPLHTGLIGQTYVLTPSLSGGTAAGNVCGWIDFNRNSVFDTAEGVCTAVAAGATSATLQWTVPIATTAGRSYVRLRASQGAQLSTATPTGRVDSGEVEDYMIEIKPAVRVIKQLSPAADPGRFDLSIGGNVFAAAAGHNGTTGFRTLYHNAASGAPDLSVAQNIATTAITTTVSESPTPATTGSYTSTYLCVNGAGAAIATGTGTSLNITLPVSVTGAAANGRAQTVTCTFTNTVAAPLPGSIVIVEDAVPNAAQDFAFTTTGAGLMNFSLDDDADGTLPNGVTFTGLAAGSYSVAQAAPPASWPLAVLACNDPDNGSSTVPGTRLANIDLDAGETVTCTFTNRLAAMSVAKSTTAATISTPGSIPYTILVTNTGSLALTGVTVNDTLPNGTAGAVTLASGDGNTNGVLDAGEAWTYTASYTATQANIDAGTALVNNVAVTTAQVTTPVTSSATTTITRTPALTVNKTTPTTSISAPGAISYSIVVANSGNVTLTGVTVNDTLPGGSAGAVTLVSGDTDGDSQLDVGETWTYSASYAATQANIDAGTALVNNVAVTTAQVATPVTSSATTTITRTPALTVNKTTPTTSISAPGAISYSIVVANSGNVTLTGVTVNDTLPGGSAGAVTLVSGDTDGDSQLDVGEIWTYGASYTATAADINAGNPLVNNVSVTTTQTQAPVSSSATTTVSQAPALSVLKTTTTTSISAPGAISYSILVTNTGNVALTGVAVVDTLPGGGNGSVTLVSGDTDGDGQLDIGEAWTYSAAYTATQADIDAGVALVNNVSVTSTQTPTPATSSATTSITRTPAMSVAKTTPTTNIGAPGLISYSIVVRNTGNVTLTGIAPLDTLPDGSAGPLTLVSGDSDGDSQLDVGETWTYGASYTATQADIQAGTPLVNNVSVTSTQTPQPVSASAITSVSQGPALSVAKTTTVASISAPGLIPYTIAVTNTGNVALANVTPVDTLPDGSSGVVTLVSGDANGNSLLDIGEAWTYSASYAATQVDIDAGVALVNRVSVSAAQLPAPVSSSATTAVSRMPALSVSKTTSVQNVAAAMTIPYTIVVTNSGNVTLTTLQLSDLMPDGSAGVLTYVAGDADGDTELDVGEAWRFATSFVVGSDDLVPGQQLVNTVSVTSAQTVAAVSASASSVVTDVAAPPVPVPTLSLYALLALAGGLGLLAGLAQRHRPLAAVAAAPRRQR
jgi:large repetitive protein